MYKVLIVVLLSAVAFGQAKPAPVTGPPASPTAGPAKMTPADSELNKILKAEHALDSYQKSGADIQLQWVGLQNQQRDLQKQFEELAPKIEAAKKALKEAEDNAAKALGLDPAKYEWKDEVEAMVPLPEPAQHTVSPDKK